MARWFVKDSAKETIQLHQSQTEFSWHGYQKQVIRPSGSQKKDKFTTYQVANQELLYLEKNLKFTWSPGLFDSTSIVYAIQWYAKQHRDLNQAKLQLHVGKKQYPLHFSEQYQAAMVQLGYGRSAAEKFRFGNQRYEIDLWLLPQVEYFPGKVRIYDREEKQTLLLTLQKLPKFN
ncbi:hypothetical protein THMIRHAS_15950 [Thiosulfatimonas sediminis]|uniref:Uncharacterized protein n=2 Tax=Thiosulfatimonas sediminis TaxID=2675054 RepID=A0A6F8PVP5_9GAMM|nr:hypothetical protein THMIRHAS_15950 [Thiosulfatimonas sediminis]